MQFLSLPCCLDLSDFLFSRGSRGGVNILLFFSFTLSTVLMDHRFAELTAAAAAVSATRFDVLISKPSLLNALHWERKRTTGHNRKKKHFQINKHTQRPEARSEFRVSASVSRSCKSPRTWEYNKKRSWLDVGDVFLLNDGCALEGLSIACQTWD